MEDAIYNVADDNPTPRTEVLQFAASLLGVELPRGLLVGDIQSERGRRRLAENKRVRNKRMRELLSPQGLNFPTYREGLLAVLGAS